jgi:alpha-galactosidase
VLDDGWFGKRVNDTCSLGDWFADLSKFPTGIKGLAEDVNAAGCRFGIWFEPEMVSEDSVSIVLYGNVLYYTATIHSEGLFLFCCFDGLYLLTSLLYQLLYASHPDWYLHVPGRPRQIGRNQMVLDLSRSEVRDYIFNALSAVLTRLD